MLRRRFLTAALGMIPGLKFALRKSGSPVPSVPWAVGADAAAFPASCWTTPDGWFCYKLEINSSDMTIEIPDFPEPMPFVIADTDLSSGGVSGLTLSEPLESKWRA